MQTVEILRGIIKQKSGGLKISSNYNDNTIAIIEKKNKLGYIEKSESSQLNSIMVDDNVVILPAVPIKRERFQIVVSGESGSGKSLISSAFCEQYHKLYPKNRIFYLCPTGKSNDQNFNKPYIKDLDFETIDQIQIEMLENSLVVIDDVDYNKNHKKAIQFLNMISETGRKFNVSLVFISHQNTNARESCVIKELDIYVTNAENLKNNRLLSHYLKIPEDVLDTVKSLNPAFVAINKLYHCIITDKTVENY